MNEKITLAYTSSIAGSLFGMAVCALYYHMIDCKGEYEGQELSRACKKNKIDLKIAISAFGGYLGANLLAFLVYVFWDIANNKSSK